MEIQKSVMKNGLVLVSEALPHLRSVSMGVWIKGGSRFEKEKSAGISHFIEHLLFKGTRSRTAVEIANVIDSVGGQLDAFTDREFVGYYARVLDSHLPTAFELLSDLILNPTFPPVEIRRERNVIYEEINTIEDTPQDLIHDLYLRTLWPGHPLGRPISGTKDSVGRITLKDIREYFDTHYTARNMVVTVAGNIRHRQVQSLARRYFAGLPPGREADPGLPPRLAGNRTVRFKPNLEQTHLCLGSNCPAVVSERRFCTLLLSSVLGGGMSSRLFQNIRERKGLVYSIESSLDLFRDAGSLAVYAGAAPRTAPKVAELTLKEFKKLKTRPVPADELQRAKEFVKGPLVLSLESSTSRMTHLAHQQMYHGKFYSMEEILENIDAVEPGDLQHLANEIFDPSHITITALDSDANRELESLEVRV
jgi:predicted Zn-dependent peptidase